MTRSSARRGPWTSDEDQMLLDLVHKQGPNNWVRISQHMQHRTPKQCRERYHQNLKQSLNHEPISHQEGELIEQMVAEMGRRWAEIARRLGNRSDNAVKNWWNGSMNRRKRNGNHRPAGFKNMGPKVQPIPAVRATRIGLMQPPRHLDYHEQLHQGSQPLLQIPSTRHHPTQVPVQYSEPPNSGIYQMFDPCLLEAGAYPNHHYGTNNASMEGYSRSTIKEDFSDHLLVPHISARPQYRGPQTLHFAHGATGEVPLVSPLGSDGSFAPSMGQTPSLVSDRRSSYSISPKTVPSPRPTILAPIDTRAYTSSWNDHSNRRSDPLISLQSKSAPPDEGYASAITPLEIKQYQHLSDYTAIHRPRSHDEYRYQGQSLPLDLSPSSAKDARMNVSSLLH